MELRQLKQKDAERMLEWMHDPDINAYFRTDFSSFLLSDVEKFINSSYNDRTKHLAVVEDDLYLGTVSLKNIDCENKNAEYAICMHKSAIGTGASAFATQEILKFGFETLKLHKIYLNVLSDNIRAIKFYKKMGFVQEGEFIEHLCIKGEYKSLMWFSKINENIHYEEK